VNLNKIKKKQFIKNGYFIGKINPKILKALRKKYFEIFNTVSKLTNGIKVKNDSDLIKLYNSKKRFVWEAAYDLRLFEPLLYKLAATEELMNLAKIAGIKKPHFKTVPVLRIDMPEDSNHSYKMHQDYPFSSGSKNSITMWIPLQDVTTKNGCLKIVEGSHKGKKIYKTHKDNIIQSRHKFSFKDVQCKMGDVLIFSQCLVHKSGNNNSKSARFSIQIRFNDLSKKDSISKILKEKFNLRKGNKAI